MIETALSPDVEMQPFRIDTESKWYPRQMLARLGQDAPAQLTALGNEVCFAHITPGGQSERLTHRLAEWRVPFSRLEKS